MKSVMLSIKPKYCELIKNGRKTIEVRKTRPKVEMPFKCYIYCTKEKYNGRFLHTSDKNGCLLFWLDKNDCTIIRQLDKNDCTIIRQPEDISYTAYTCNGKVIGEFICDVILPIAITYSDSESRIALKEFPFTGLTDKQILDYLGNGKQGYGWHITNLVIYDKPKRLSEFWHCGVKKGARVSRAPQSWFYVEG